MNLANIFNTILLGNTKLSGLRTIIVNTILMVIALWDFLAKDGGLFEMLCDTGVNLFCTISETQFYMVALVVNTALNNILRWLTVTPAGVEASPAELRIAHAGEDGRQRFAKVVAIGSAVVIIGLIASAII